MTQTQLLLIPGTFCNKYIWQAQIDALQKDAIVSVVEPPRQDNLYANARDILKHAPPRFSVAGHSSGGYLVFELLRQAPERVERIALLNTNCHAADAEHETPMTEAMLARAYVEDIVTLAEEILPVLLSKHKKDDAEIKNIYVSMAEEVGIKILERQVKALLARPDSTSDLKHITCPTLIVAADKDVLISVAEHEQMAELIPNSRMEIIEDCGHLSTLEKPEQVNTLMIDWINS
jgi:pimeloyl-ACP methyl ester carboxylesterase